MVSCFGPGGLTGPRFVKEEKGYHLFSVFMARGQKLDLADVAFPDMEFEAGGSRAVFGPAAVGEPWLRLGGAYATAAQHDKPAPRPRESGPGGGGQ